MNITEFFKSKGFEHESSRSGSEVTWSDLEGSYVAINENSSEFCLFAVKGLVISKIGVCGYPNKNINVMLDQVRSHA